MQCGCSLLAVIPNINFYANKVEFKRTMSRKVTKCHERCHLPILGYIHVHPTGNYTECLFKVMIMNVEVERNAKAKILSQFVVLYQFEPKKGHQIP